MKLFLLAVSALLFMLAYGGDAELKVEKVKEPEEPKEDPNDPSYGQVDFMMMCTNANATKDACKDTKKISSKAEKVIESELGIPKDEMSFGSNAPDNKEKYLRSRELLPNCKKPCNPYDWFCIWWCTLRRRRLTEAPPEDPVERELQERRNCDAKKVAAAVEREILDIAKGMEEEHPVCSLALKGVTCDATCEFKYA